LENVSPNITRPAVSVCVPTHNRPHLLQRALRSVGAQDYAGLIQCVVSENGRDSRVLALVEEMAIEYPHVKWRLIQDDVLISPVNNWRRAISAAESAWVKILWDDDWLEPSCLSALASCADITAADVVTCGARVVSPSGGTRELYRDVPAGALHGPQEVLERLANIKEPLPVSPAASLVARDMCLQGIDLSASLEGCLDRAMGPDLCLLYYAVFSGGRIAHTPEVLVNFWAGGDSITMTSDELTLRLCYDRAMLLLAASHNVDLPQSVRKRLQHRSFLAWARREKQRDGLLRPVPQVSRLLVNVWERRQFLWSRVGENVRGRFRAG
jgi:glycosyltransferase involved in cell wall biosynthesis